jgi:exodeoxyribonuclease VII large subunit
MSSGTVEKASNCPTLSVSELIQAFQSALASTIPFIRVKGEISELSRPASGHIYLTLADESSSFPMVMWRGSAKDLSFQLNPGIAVVVEGRPSIYNVTGKLQLVASRILPLGDGVLQQKFLELKNKLEKEGLFSDARKRALPSFPRSIGIVTSATGAAIHDIMTRLQDRMPGVRKYLIDVRVQGPGAAGEIADAIDRFNALKLCDVLIVGRGGGSLEDLWAFNEEVVVRAIFRSGLPVISAVGHEIDVTLSDLVADVRAPTPTAAAEMVVPKAVDLLRDINQVCKRLRIVSDKVGLSSQRVDELIRRFRSSLNMLSQRRSLTLTSLESKLKLISPGSVLTNFRLKISGLLGNLLRSGLKVSESGRGQLARIRPLLFNLPQSKIVLANQHVESMEHRLSSVHPSRTLERGYAIARTAGKVVRDTKGLVTGQELEITLSKGVVVAGVIKTKEV